MPLCGTTNLLHRIYQTGSFQSPPLRGTTECNTNNQHLSRISIPVPLAGHDCRFRSTPNPHPISIPVPLRARRCRFRSTPNPHPISIPVPLRGARPLPPPFRLQHLISIPVPLRGTTPNAKLITWRLAFSIPVPCGARPPSASTVNIKSHFNPRALAGTTVFFRRKGGGARYFNRAPCGHDAPRERSYSI